MLAYSYEYLVYKGKMLYSKKNTILPTIYNHSEYLTELNESSERWFEQARLEQWVNERRDWRLIGEWHFYEWKDW